MGAGPLAATRCARPLIVSPLDRPGRELLLDALERDRAEPSGVIGPRECAAALARVWARRSGRDAVLSMEHVVYEARAVRMPPDDGAGALTVATGDDRDRVRSWLVEFICECFPDPRLELPGVDALLARLLPARRVFLWRTVHGEPVAMAARCRESPNGATVSYVFTPEDRRGRGYATMAVAHLARRILDDGKSHCSLFADRSNLASNRVYRKIGFQVVGEVVEYRLEAGSTDDPASGSIGTG